MRTKGSRELWTFLVPALIILVVFYFLPMILTIYISFTPLRNWNINRYAWMIIGWRNYYRLFHAIQNDPSVRAVFLTTVVFVSVTLLINVLGGLLLALINFFVEKRSNAIINTIWLLPRMAPIAVYSLVWYYFFHGSEIGTLNSIFLKLGLIQKPISWGQEYLPYGAWSVIIFVNGLVGVSFGMIVLSSAISSIPAEHVIAARVDGATDWQLCKRILIPQIRWHIMYVATWQLLSLLTSYAHTYLLVSWRLVDKSYGTPWALYVYELAFTGIFDQGFAAAAGVLLVIVGAFLGWITLKILGFDKLLTEPRGDL
ncbi:carbohydrate ABC transporter permease [Pseudothermotoga thermarum]|uniref:Carbohydrate ABC transporter membrane protein 1, CUT1 family n=1 Tax=Pseudothermotoga thermarum DSM 5069 TaxID=688269 RepID=F7YX50_9THEM|nr:sugar ABC transporter permease [Pseudothermotoga thermarum]AEH50880.1 carbohydrate ABC transporter membrane protein 1, CUT1 family [Pseudothermotoga thermarum DSM 5069]